VVTRSSSAREILDRAHASRSAGRGELAARLYADAAALFRDLDDLDGWTESALGAASVHVFGTEPGRLPALLYDLLARTTDDQSRARLSASLARCWAYADHADRAAQFAAEAVECAERVGDPALTADCLDAALASHWGPDELDVRRQLAKRLDDVAAHVLDPDTRLQSHLWCLQVSCEALDVPAVYRELRALERLGEESTRAQFFAASRRQMLDLLRGRTDTHDRLRDIAARAAERAGLADAWLVLSAMDGYAAAQRGDKAECAKVAAAAENFATNEGVTAVAAEAAYLWLAAGERDHARALVRRFDAPTLDGLPRDVNWMLTVQCVLEIALDVDEMGVVEAAESLLRPYEGRAVFNAGAVMFHGVTDDTLARAAAVRGDVETFDRLFAAAVATYDRIGAQWWRERLLNWRPPPPIRKPNANRRAHLRPDSGGLWLIGLDGAVSPVRPLRGLGYLRELVRRPGQSVAALDLVGRGGALIEADMGELSDRQALAAYRTRLRELDDELSEATAWADQGRLAGLRLERDAIFDEINRSLGLGGRSRVVGGSGEKARVAVKKAITVAVDRIATVDEQLAQHLRSSLRTGARCSYEPADGDVVEWVTG
jgi:hypothetical protein